MGNKPSVYVTSTNDVIHVKGNDVNTYPEIQELLGLKLLHPFKYKATDESNSLVSLKGVHSLYYTVTEHFTQLHVVINVNQLNIASKKLELNDTVNIIENAFNECKYSNDLLYKCCNNINSIETDINDLMDKCQDSIKQINMLSGFLNKHDLKFPDYNSDISVINNIEMPFDTNYDDINFDVNMDTNQNNNDNNNNNSDDTISGFFKRIYNSGYKTGKTTDILYTNNTTDNSSTITKPNETNKDNSVTKFFENMDKNGVYNSPSQISTKPALSLSPLPTIDVPLKPTNSFSFQRLFKGDPKNNINNNDNNNIITNQGSMEIISDDDDDNVINITQDEIIQNNQPSTLGKLFNTITGKSNGIDQYPTAKEDLVYKPTNNDDDDDSDSDSESQSNSNDSNNNNNNNSDDNIYDEHVWVVNDKMKKEYDNIFKTLILNENKAAGKEIMKIMYKSGLKKDILRDIWNLADIDQDGKMDDEEFAICMYLIGSIKNGKKLPESLPMKYVPINKRHFFL